MNRWEEDALVARIQDSKFKAGMEELALWILLEIGYQTFALKHFPELNKVDPRRARQLFVDFLADDESWEGVEVQIAEEEK